MIQKLKNAVLILALSLGLAVPAFVGVASAAQAPNTITSGLCDGVNDAAGGSKADCVADTSGAGSLKTVAGKIVNIFSILVGIVAVIMVIYGGFRYITSGGDSGKVGNAKNTLIYAVVGLIIVALAQFLVHYVLTTASESI
jgi:hypothetical protein